MTIAPTLRSLVAATTRLAGAALAAAAGGAAQAGTLDAPAFAGVAPDSSSSLLLATALMCLAWTFSKHDD